MKDSRPADASEDACPQTAQQPAINTGVSPSGKIIQLLGNQTHLKLFSSCLYMADAILQTEHPMSREKGLDGQLRRPAHGRRLRGGARAGAGRTSGLDKTRRFL